LQGAAHGEVKQKREKADGKGTHVGKGQDGYIVGEAEAFVEERNEPDGESEEGSNGNADVDPVNERAVAIFATAGAEGLGDECFEADENTFAEKDEDDVNAGADADSGNGSSTVGKAADHHGVDNGHAHPADFGENEREGEVQSGTELGAKSGESEHGSVERVYWWMEVMPMGEERRGIAMTYGVAVGVTGEALTGGDRWAVRSIDRGEG